MLFSSLTPNETPQNQEMDIHGKKIYFKHNKLSIDGDWVKLPPTACRLFKHLLHHPEKIFSREQLLNSVWSKEKKIDARAVDANIRLVRNILERFDLTHILQTIHGVGYRIVEEPMDAPI